MGISLCFTRRWFFLKVPVVLVPVLWQETGQRARKREPNPACGKYEGNSSRVKNSGSVGTFWAGSTPRCKQTAIPAGCPTAMCRNPLSSPGRGPGASRAGQGSPPARPRPLLAHRGRERGDARRKKANVGRLLTRAAGGRAVRGLLGAR